MSSIEAQHENGTLFAAPEQPLPEEMLVEIFLHCVASEELSDYLPSSRSPPFTLTWVCRSWRRLAISTQKLWTKICLGERGSDPANDVRLLELWVDRAGPTRTIEIKMCHEMKDSERPVFFDPMRGELYLMGMRMLTDKLISISHRWKTLDLHALDLFVLDPILRALVTGAPQLQNLSISTKYFDFFGSVHFIDLSSCPALQDMHLLCPMLCPSGDSKIASKMKNLEIRFCPLMRDCLTWLHICPNLEKLNVRFFRAVSSTLPRGKGMVVLPKLKELSISCFSDDSDPTPLLDLLVLPALRDLSLDMNGLVDSRLSGTWSDEMHGIISRSNSPLERLALLGTPMTAEVLIRLLKITPDLKELSLSGSVVTDQVLVSLAVNYGVYNSHIPPEGTMFFSLCPKLESLELRDLENCSLDALVSVIFSSCRASRSGQQHLDLDSQRNPGYLKKISLLWCPHPTLLEHPCVRKCIDGGLEAVNRAYQITKPQCVSGINLPHMLNKADLSTVEIGR